MTISISKSKSPRHGIPYSHLPTVKGSVWGGSFTPYDWKMYGSILDSVEEMADMLSTVNGVPVEAAIEQTLADNGWRVLPRHRKLIASRLA